MDQMEHDDDDDDVRDLSSDDLDQEEMNADDNESLDDVEKVNDLDFIAQHAAEPWVFSSDVSKEGITTTSVTEGTNADNHEEIEMNQSDDESEEEQEEEELDPVVNDMNDDNESSSDDESDILEMERNTARNDSYTSNKAEAINWLTEEEENIPSGPPRTRNEVDENYDVFDPNELDLAGTVVISNIHEGSSSSSCRTDNPTGQSSIEHTLKIRSVAQQDLVQIGKVLYRIDHEYLVVIEANYTMTPLNEGSVLCAENGLVLGKICEVFGPITNPFYILRWGYAKGQTTTSTSSSGSVGGRDNGKNGEKGKKKPRQGKGKSKEDLMEIEKEVNDEVAVIEEQNEEKDEDEGRKVSGRMREQKEVSVGEVEIVGMMESKESKDDEDVISINETNVSSTAATTTTTTTTSSSTTTTTTTATTTAVPLASEISNKPSPDHIRSHDIHAVTHHSFFTAVIVPSCQPGNIVCCASQHSIVITPVSLSELLRSQGKGTDASNFYDEEVGEEEQEYSDDEKELLARQARNKRDRQPSKRGGEGKNGNGNGMVSMGYAGSEEMERMRQHKGSEKGVGKGVGFGVGKGLGKGLDKMKYGGSSYQSTSHGGRGHMSPGQGLGQAQGPGLGSGQGPGPHMMNTHNSSSFGSGVPYGQMYQSMPPPHLSHPNFYPQDGYHHQPPPPNHHHQHPTIPTQPQQPLYSDFAHGSQLHDHQSYPQQSFPPYPPTSSHLPSHLPSQPYYAEPHPHHQQYPQDHHQHQLSYQPHYQQQYHDPQFSSSYSFGSAPAPGLGQGPAIGSFKPPLPPSTTPLQFNFPSHVHSTSSQVPAQLPSQPLQQPPQQSQQQPQPSSSSTSTSLPKYVYKPITFQFPKP